MAALRGTALTPLKLRLFLLLLFVLLAVPSLVLLGETQGRLKWEAFHRYRVLAEELARGIDADLRRRIAAEEARGQADFEFLAVAGSLNGQSLVQPSTLAGLPVASALPGVVGYFQIDAAGRFSTPLLPADHEDAERWGIARAQIAQRAQIERTVVDVLERHQLIDASPADSEKTGSEAPRVAQFDDLNAPAQQAVRLTPAPLARVEDLRQLQNFQRSDTAAQQRLLPSAANAEAPRGKRTETAAVVDAPARLDTARIDESRLHIFRSEVDPFEFSLLDDRHAVLYRKVWRHGQRTIQGAVVDWNALLDGIVVEAFRRSALSAMSDLAVAYRHDVVRFARAEPAAAGSDELKGELLHQARLSAPLGDMLLLWNIERLPGGSGARLVGWTGAVLFAVLIVGFVLLDRLGMRQIRLARQQRNFVAAVSHELNTPLTSIRMYAEMLDAGWAGEEKKRAYYRFIHDESRRLTRLIANVLSLARLERDDARLELRPMRAAALSAQLCARFDAQIEHAGFVVRHALDTDCAGREIVVDADALLQIVINLVDNALKFSARAEHRQIDIGIHADGPRRVAISVRDYGPGVARRETRRIFSLFYRSGDELTRETPGTGIGLALARQLARAMGGDVVLVHREPGAEFRVLLPSREATAEDASALPE